MVNGLLVIGIDKYIDERLEDMEEGLKGYVDKVAAELAAKLGLRFDVIGTRFDSVGERFDNMGDRFDSLGNRIGALEGRMYVLEGEVRGQMQGLRDSMDGLRSEYRGLEHRFEGLADRFEALRHDVHAAVLRFETSYVTVQGQYSQVMEMLGVLLERTDPNKIGFDKESEKKD